MQVCRGGMVLTVSQPSNLLPSQMLPLQRFTNLRPRMAAPPRPGAASARGASEGGQKKESVWDYPRPPALLRVDQRLRVLVGEQVGPAPPASANRCWASAAISAAATAVSAVAAFPLAWHRCAPLRVHKLSPPHDTRQWMWL